MHQLSFCEGFRGGFQLRKPSLFSEKQHQLTLLFTSICKPPRFSWFSRLIKTMHCNDNLHKVSCANLPPKGFLLQTCMFFQTFPPNLPIFLHGYIRHICDILQLCLRLFDQLFGVVLVAYCSVGFVMTFGIAIVKDIFHTDFGFKVCTLRSISDHDVWRKNVMPLFSPFLVWTTCMYFKFKTNRYLYRICPQQKMSIIGKFRRNFITFEQTTQFMHVYFFYGIINYGIFFSYYDFGLDCAYV